MRSARKSAARSRRAGKEDTVDPALSEKKRARRRLIGVVALVLAMVIVLPMILDSEPRPLADDISIQIPSRNSVADARPAALAPATEQPTAVPVTEKTAVDAKVDVKEDRTEATMADRLAGHQDDHRKEKDAGEASKPKTAWKPDDDARAVAILEGRSVAPASGAFVIQVAVLTTQEKIDELRNKLGNASIKSYTQRVATQSGEGMRIRVGPFANRNEADKMRARINKLGLNATIVPA
ncbi:MAG: SPOR domain-containing protein [Herbaspirillum sp.]